MKKLMLSAMLFCGLNGIAQVSLGEVIGEVKARTNDPAVGAMVFIEDQGQLYRTKADLDGRFRLSAIPPGKYELKIRFQNDTTDNIWVDVPMDGFANIGEVMVGKVTKFKDIVFSAKDRIIMRMGNLPVKELTMEDLKHNPRVNDIKGMVEGMSSDVQRTEDGELVVRGARKGDMIYLIDGVKTRDAGQLPGVAIGRMQLYSGNLPAKYGDTLGGVVVLETKSYFDLYRRWRSAQIRAGKG